MELLAPAGDLEKLKIAVIYGADAVFIGGLEYSLRSRASNFTIDDIKEGCRFAHEHGAKIHVTTNIVPHNENVENIRKYLLELENAGVDAVIASSMSIIKEALKTKMEVHVSTQASTANIEAIKFWKSLGVHRVVLAREVTLDEMEYIKKNVDIEIEAFIHGGMCVSYSGRCMLSNEMTDRDANRGGCAHSCRWNYDIYKNNEKINDSYFAMSSKDLQGVCAIPRMMDMNIDSFKIEGRMKSIHYIATVVSSYRRLMDDYKNGCLKDFSYYEGLIKKAENRLTSTGFLNGLPTKNEQLYNLRSEQPTQEFVGIVLDYKDGFAKIEERNYFDTSKQLEVFGPKTNETTFKIDKIFDENMNELDAARHPKQILYIKVPIKVNKYDMIRIAR